jgi:hypothetical protein
MKMQLPITIIDVLPQICDMTGSATRKPRLVGGDKGLNKKQTASLPGSPALWAGSFNSGNEPIKALGEKDPRWKS